MNRQQDRRQRGGGSGPAPSRRWWRHLVACLAVAWSLAPVAALVVAAFTRSPEAGACPECAVGNLADLFADPGRPYSRWYLNSLVTAAIAAGVVTLVGVAAAYGGSRSRRVSKRTAGDGLLLLQAFPVSLAVIGLYLTVGEVGKSLPQLGRNSWLGLALCYVGVTLAWVTWLVWTELAAVPTEIADAATLDGAGHVRIFAMTVQHFRGTLWAVLAVVFVGVYGEFMLASVLLTEPGHQTLAVGLAELARGPAQFQGRFAVGALLACLPGLLAALAYRRRLAAPALLRPLQ